MKLADSFIKIREYVANNNKDWVHINDGEEGSGKFNLTALILEKCLTPEELKEFFTHIKEYLFYTIDEFGYAVRNSNPYEFKILDEPVELLARTPTAHSNIELMRTLFTCREKHQITVINVQRPFTIDWIVRDRARSLAHAYYITDTKRLRDSYFYKFFSKARMRKIWFEEKTHIVHYPYPNYYDRVANYFGDRFPRYWKMYLAHKNSMTYLQKEEQAVSFKEFLKGKDEGDINYRYKEYMFAKGNRKKEKLINWAKRFETSPKQVETWLKEVDRDGL